MANGEMLAELRAILESDNTLPAKATTRLILASMADVIERITAQDNAIVGLVNQVDILHKSLGALELAITSQNCGTCTVRKFVDKNPFMRFLYWADGNRKTAWSIFTFSVVTFLILSTFWLDPTVRRLTFEFFRFPVSWVDVLTR